MFPNITDHTFPQKGTPWLRILFYLQTVHRLLKKRGIENNLGWLYSLPHQVAIKTYALFLDQNPHHSGSWSHTKHPDGPTQQVEHNIIMKMSHLYHASRAHLEGYITSGATESNLYSVWAGKKYLRQFAKSKNLCLIKTNLTHYSITKAADIAEVQQYTTPLSHKNWCMHPEGLTKTIASLYKKGYRGFMIPLTLGYTSTGTSDNIDDITNTLLAVQRIHRTVKFFVWVDAALNGLVLPFLDKKFSPFSSPLIQTVAVDFHKFGLVPYPAGIVLYRKKLRKLIEQPIDYAPQMDTTVLGSRSGIPALAIWTMIHHLGIDGYSKLARRQHEHKNYFIHHVTTLLPKTQIITDDVSISCGVIFHSLKNQSLTKTIENKYGLFAKKIPYTFYPSMDKSYKVYKFYFLPHVTRRVIDKFFHDFTQVGIRRRG